MKEQVPLNRLWEWWLVLAREELDLERQYKPLVAKHDEVHRRRGALENLMATCGELQEVNQQISSRWEELRKSQKLPTIERKPVDAAYDILARGGRPLHYRDLLAELIKVGVVVGGRDPGTTLIAYLGRDKRFTKAREVGRGFWRLSEWNSREEQ